MYAIYNTKQELFYEKVFHTETEARHWVINHLDLSEKPKILSMKSEDYNKLATIMRGKTL